MKKYSREELIKVLQEKGEEVGGIPSSKYFDKNNIKPSASAIKSHFGSWSKALKEAGFKARRGSSKGNIYSEEELLDMIRIKAKELGRIPRAVELEKYDTIRNRFGSLENAIKKADLNYKRYTYAVKKREVLLEGKRKVHNNESVSNILKRINLYFGSYDKFIGEIEYEKYLDLEDVHKSKMTSGFAILKLLYLNREMSVRDMENILNLSQTNIHEYIKQLNDVGFKIIHNEEIYSMKEIPFWISDNPQKLTDE